MRIVVDTNVLVSAALSNEGPPGTIARACVDGSVGLITSPALLAELRRVLGRSRLQRRLAQAFAPDAFVQDLQSIAVLVHPDLPVSAVERDHADNRVLEAAIAGQADYIISGDRDLTDLVEFEGIPILTPAAFLVVLADERTLGPG